MFLKRIEVKKKGKVHTYWALIKSVRTARGPRQQIVAYLGELGRSERAGWAEVQRILGKRPELQGGLFDQAGDSASEVPKHVQVNVREVRVERLRDFGDVYVGWTLWKALQLDQLMERKIQKGQEDVRWDMVAVILALARFCEPSSELHIADTWYRRTALEDMLGVPSLEVNKDRLYRGLDVVLPHKEAIETHLKERFATLFDAKFDLVFYDVTSTYFEGLAKKNPQAQYGYSRDKRFDCKQVCIGLVVTREGLPVGYEVFAGNRNDMTTLEEVVKGMEKKHGAIGRIWVVDRGIASEENLQYLRQKGALYVVGTPRSRLKMFEKQLLQEGWLDVQSGVQVKMCPGPDGKETFILCRSQDRKEKEKAMHEGFARRIQEGLKSLAGRLQRARKSPDREAVGRQIGRLLGKNSRAAGLFEIQVKENGKGKRKRLRVTWKQRPEWKDWATLSEGHYLLRTNLVDWKPEDLWKTYIQLAQAEWAFRIEKSELKIRPIWHQLEKRVQAHILFSFLAYAMWKTLEQWMARSGLGNGPRTVLEDLARLKTMDVVLPTSTGRQIRLKCVSQPDQGQRILLSRLGLKLPMRLGQPRWMKTRMSM